MTILSGKDIFTADFNKFDFIVPLNYEEASFCFSKVPNFTSQLICAHPVTISLLNNKHECNSWLITEGFQENIPMAYFVDIGGYEIIFNKIKYPAILKPITSHSGIGVRYVKDGIIKWNVTFVAKNKKFHIKKGAIKNYKVADINIDLFKEIFSKLNYNGFACCDFKIKDGVIKIFEINARIGGSLLEHRTFFNCAMDSMVAANQLQEA